MCVFHLKYFEKQVMLLSSAEPSKEIQHISESFILSIKFCKPAGSNFSCKQFKYVLQCRQKNERLLE